MRWGDSAGKGLLKPKDVQDSDRAVDLLRVLRSSAHVDPTDHPVEQPGIERLGQPVA